MDLDRKRTKNHTHEKKANLAQFNWLIWLTHCDASEKTVIFIIDNLGHQAINALHNRFGVEEFFLNSSALKITHY